MKRIYMKTGALLSRQRIKRALPLAMGDILDIGCSRGLILDYLPLPERYVGVDWNEALIEESRRRHPHSRFYALDVQKGLRIEEEPFNTILLLAVMEHVVNPAALLEECRRFLLPGGMLVITTPTPLGDRVHRLLEKLGLLSPGVEEAHLHIFGKKDLRELVASSGFSVQEQKLFELGMNQLLVARG